MIDLGAAATGLTGAWRLARLDRGGMRYFDATEAGFWRSFQAAILAVPFYAILLLVEPRPPDQALSPDPLRAILIEAIGYVIRVTAFPLAAWYLARGFNCSGRYIAFVVAYNWANLLQVIVFFPIVVLAAATDMSADTLAIPGLIFAAAVFYYEYFIARAALAVDALPALTFVGTDFLIAIVVGKIQIYMQLH